MTALLAHLRPNAPRLVEARLRLGAVAISPSPVLFRTPLPLSRYADLCDRIRRIRPLEDVETAREGAVAFVLWMLLAVVFVPPAPRGRR